MLRSIFLLLVVGLAGCAQLPSSPQSAAVTRAVGQSFVLNGRMAVQHHGERTSVNLRWVHQADGDDILLMAPLGLTVAHIQRNAQGVVLEAGDKRYQETDTERLMDKVIGWHLPLDEFYAWVMARPYPATPFEIGRNEFQQIDWLRQDGWAIRYQRFLGAEPDSLPQKMWMKHDDMDLQLVVDEWEMTGQ